MGNHHASGQYSSSCKVILSDGTVEQFHEPLTVAELMLEYPQQVVVEFKSVYNNSKLRPAPLPADMVLEMKTVYVMVPVRRGRPISTDEAQKILFRANAMLRTTNYISSSLPFTGIIPFIAGRMCSAGVKADKKANGGVSMLMDKKKDKKLRSDRAEFSKVEFSMELVDEIPQFFIRRELSGKGWKPTLDTIKEKIVEHTTVYRR